MSRHQVNQHVNAGDLQMINQKKSQEKLQKLYKYALHHKHPSGIGTVFSHYLYTDVKPSFDLGFWQDLTNHEWAKTSCAGVNDENMENRQ